MGMRATRTREGNYYDHRAERRLCRPSTLHVNIRAGHGLHATMVPCPDDGRRRRGPARTLTTPSRLPAFKIPASAACTLRFMAVAHRFVITAAHCLCLMTVHSAFAQEKLSVNQLVNQTVTAGGPNKYPIRLNDGDYVEVSLASQSGTVNLLVANPDGSLMRDFAGPSIGARNTYAFAAEGAGIFS
jgi:hypothetical protein